MSEGNDLGAFLRARRAQLAPEDAGISRGARRRVPGLRREEVAMLAGISPEYYLRLEQGRDRHPSAQILDAIADALRLDAASRTYVFEIATTPSRSVAAPIEPSADGLTALIAVLNVPAFVMDRYRNVLAANALALALDPGLRVGINRVASLFTDVDARAALRDWERDAADLVAQLRADVRRHHDDPRFAALVSELSRNSDTFRDLWSRHDVKFGGSGPTVVQHPLVGEIALRREKLTVEPHGHIVALYHPDAGSTSAARLDELFRSLP